MFAILLALYVLLLGGLIMAAALGMTRWRWPVMVALPVLAMVALIFSFAFCLTLMAAGLGPGGDRGLPAGPRQGWRELSDLSGTPLRLRR